MFYDELSNKTIHACYILINNKFESGYKKSLKAFLRLITLEGTLKLNIKTICTDFEPAIINIIKELFPQVRHVGCFFHYVQGLRREMGKLGLINECFEYEKLLKELSSIPFTYNKNKNIVNDLFANFEKIYEKNNVYSTTLCKFKTYYNKVWFPFLLNG